MYFILWILFTYKSETVLDGVMRSGAQLKMKAATVWQVFAAGDPILFNHFWI